MARFNKYLYSGLIACTVCPCNTIIHHHLLAQRQTYVQLLKGYFWQTSSFAQLPYRLQVEVKEGTTGEATSQLLRPVKTVKRYKHDWYVKSGEEILKRKQQRQAERKRVRQPRPKSSPSAQLALRSRELNRQVCTRYRNSHHVLKMRLIFYIISLSVNLGGHQQTVYQCCQSPWRDETGEGRVISEVCVKAT